MRLSTGKLAKTDAIDARILAHFGEAMKPQVLAAESEQARQLTELMSRRRQLIEMRTAETHGVTTDSKGGEDKLFSSNTLLIKS